MNQRSMIEPKRWSDPGSDAPDLLRQALQDERNTMPELARVSRLAERLGLDASLTAAAVVGSSVIPPSAAVAYKLWVYLSGVAVVSGAALVLWLSAPTEAASERQATTVSAEAFAVVPPQPIEPPPVITDQPTVAAEPKAAANLSGASLAQEQPAPANVSPRPAVATPRRRSPAPEAALPLRASRTPPAKLDPQAELAVLNQAQSVLLRAPRRALSLAGEHETRFPSGVFAQEREVIAIEALLRLQRNAEAAARGDAFLEQYPRSTHAPRVQQMLGR